MLLYEKREDGERHIYGSWEHTVPSENDSRIVVEGGEGSLDKHYYDDKRGGIIDEDGNPIKIILDGVEVFPRRLNPEPPVPPTPIDPIEPVDEDTINGDVGYCMTHFVDDVYNKKETGAYLNRENDEDVANYYYVHVASNVDASYLDQISIGNVDLTKEFALSIGKSAFVYDMPYYVDDNNDMYVAFPLLIFEADVRVGDEIIYTGYDKAVGTLELSEVRIAGNGGSEASMDEDKNVSATMKNRTDYILYGLAGLESAGVFITKKESDDHYDDGTSKHPISYGFSTGDPVGDGFGMGYYPFGWASTPEAWNEKPRTISHEYTLHVLHKGVARIHSDFTRIDM